jgi:hypothetical protein
MTAIRNLAALAVWALAFAFWWGVAQSVVHPGIHVRRGVVDFARVDRREDCAFRETPASDVEDEIDERGDWFSSSS